MEYAMLSTLIPEEYREEFYNQTRNTMQDAASALQWNIYRGLCENLGRNIALFNILPCDSYPQYYEHPFVPKFAFDTNGQNLPFCNVKLIRNYFKAKAVEKALRNWCRNTKEPKTLFVYTLSQPFLAAVNRVKKQFEGLHICAIVADLPNMSSLSSKVSILSKLFVRQKSKSAYSLLSCVDSFVLLTEHMAEYMHITKPFCVMEGIAPEQTVETEEPKSSAKTILYTGTLHRKFGVLHLIEAFEKIPDPDISLVICGMGDSEQEIRTAAERDERIIFKGQMKQEQVLWLQKNATVLVNPRLNNEEFTKYSFPSKTMEYLASGIPVVAYKLDGMPDEYDSYITYPADDSPETLAETLMSICRLSEKKRREMGKKAHAFVCEQKNRLMQTKKILEFVSQQTQHLKSRRQRRQTKRTLGCFFKISMILGWLLHAGCTYVAQKIQKLFGNKCAQTVKSFQKFLDKQKQALWNARDRRRIKRVVRGKNRKWIKVETICNLFFQILLLIVWTQHTVLQYVAQIFRRLPIIGVAYDFLVPILIAIMVILSLPYIFKKVRATDLLFIIACVLMVAFSYLLYPANQIYIEEQLGKIFLYVLPMYFVGIACRYEECKKTLFIASLAGVATKFVYQMYLFGAGSLTGEYNMDAAYKLLPSVMFLIVWALDKKGIWNWLAATFGIFLILTYGTRGPLLAALLFLCLGIYIVVMRSRKLFVRIIFIVLTTAVLLLLSSQSLLTVVLEGLSEWFESIGFSSRILDFALEGELSVSVRRGLLLDNTIQAVKQRSFLGYGIMGDRVILDGSYCHNIFWELLCDFGVYLGGGLFAAMIVLFIRTIKHSAKNENLLFVVMLISMIVTKLMLSGSYITEPYFLFTIGVCINTLRNSTDRSIIFVS